MKDFRTSFYVRCLYNVIDTSDSDATWTQRLFYVFSTNKDVQKTSIRAQSRAPFKRPWTSYRVGMSEIKNRYSTFFLGRGEIMTYKCSQALNASLWKHFRERKRNCHVQILYIWCQCTNRIELWWKDCLKQPP